MNAGEIYRLCIIQALESDCAKMGFGCVAINTNGVLVGLGHNSRHDSLSEFCDGGNCIRNTIPSRTQNMLGACHHAEEGVIWKLIRAGQGHKMNEINLYIAGVLPDGKPYKKMNQEFTCLRCAVLMENAGVNSISVWDDDDMWTRIKPTDAVKMAMSFALGQKKVDSK